MEPTASGPFLGGQQRPWVQLKSVPWAIKDLGFRLTPRTDSYTGESYLVCALKQLVLKLLEQSGVHAFTVKGGNDHLENK